MTFEAIGTHWQIDMYEALSPEREGALLSMIQKRIDQFDKIYSRFRSDSLITEMSQKAGDYILPDDGKELFDLYLDLYKKTNGLFTPLVGELLSDAGYDALYSLQQKNVLQQPPALEDVLIYNFPKLTIKKPILIDVGAAGKGYLVDIIARLLEQEGISQYCVDAGGDMTHRGATPIRVGLEHPHDFAQVIGVVELQNKSLCGSAGSRRKWRTFNHIMNPITTDSVRDIVAVWVIADTTILADAIATCLFLVPAHTLTGYAFEYLLVRDDMSVEKSELFRI